MKRSGRTFILLLTSALALGALQAGCVSDTSQTEMAPSPAGQLPAAPLAAPVPQLSTQELDQLVAPIALYPDPLVAQILAAATHPTQIVEADRWLREHADLKGDALAKGVDSQSWDPGVKALTQFPGLLGMMDNNLSWTSSLGDAYENGQQDVLNAIQAMRKRAQQAGNLKSSEQQSVTADGDAIVIEPADPQIVYVPEYDPWLVYGDPLEMYPDWLWAPGFFFEGPGIVFGLGIGIGFFDGFGWGWHRWGTDWHGHGLIHGTHPYLPHSREFGDRNAFGSGRAEFDSSGGFLRGTGIDHAGIGRVTTSGVRSGAFSGFSHGGNARAFSSRGRASFGGGFHGGGGHR